MNRFFRAALAALFVLCALPARALELPKLAEVTPAYWAQFPSTRAAGWDKGDVFPTLLFLYCTNTAADVASDKALQVAGYLNTCGDGSLIEGSGLIAFTTSAKAVEPASVIGRVIASDEADGRYGGGWGPWRGLAWEQTNRTTWGACNPSQAAGGKCGFTVVDWYRKQIPATDGRPVYLGLSANTIFATTDRTGADTFLNGLGAHLAAADAYPYTADKGIVCSRTQLAKLVLPNGGAPTYSVDLTDDQCRLAHNYGLEVANLIKTDALDGKLMPIGAIVETIPQGKGTAITGAQYQGAVMASVRAGAKFLVIFGSQTRPDLPCNDYYSLRTSCGAAIRPFVTAMNAYLKKMAPVINAQGYQYTAPAGVTTLLKEAADGTVYLFAGPSVRPNGTAATEFALPPGVNVKRVTATTLGLAETSVEVPVVAGKFRWTFKAESDAVTFAMAPPPRDQQLTVSLKVGTLTRSALVFVPGQCADGGCPLVLMFHGAGGSGQAIAKQTGWAELAKAEGFIAVFPNGTDGSCAAMTTVGGYWNAGSGAGQGAAEKCNVDDIGFVRALLSDLSGKFGIGDVFAAGFSKGGMFSYRLACEMADTFKAIAPVSTARTVAICRPSRGVPIWTAHGVQDDVIPFIGNELYRSYAADNLITAGLNGCSLDVETLPPAGDATGYRFKDCTAALEVWQLQGLDHSWPHGSEFDATARAWAFFQAQQ